MKLRGVLVGMAAMAALFGSSHANAALIVAADGASNTGYVGGSPSVAYTANGVEAQFVNLDSAAEHDVVRTTVVRKVGTTYICDSGCGSKTAAWCTALETQRNTCPQFRSDLIGLGSAAVEGSGGLPTGSYTFNCSLHDNMKGVLNIAA